MALPSPAALLSSRVIDLGKQHPGVLREELAGFDGDGHAQRTQVPVQDGGVGVQVEGTLALHHHRGQSPAGVDLPRSGSPAPGARWTMTVAAATARSNAGRSSVSRWCETWKWMVSIVSP